MKTAMIHTLMPMLFGLLAVQAIGETSDPKPPPFPRLILPPAIYAVTGHEINIYFDNIMLVGNIRNYQFEVRCGQGRQWQNRWQYVPREKDPSSFPMGVKVMDEAGRPVAEAATTVYVTSPDAGKGRKMTLMVVGDSNTGGFNDHYTQELRDLLRASGVEVALVGANESKGGRAGAEGVVTEAYPGWSWSAFCTRWTEEKEGQAKSNFLRLINNVPTLDFQNYCTQYNQGKPPDFITVLLGCNDVATATDETIEKTLDVMFEHADRLLGEFRKVGPQTKIGLALYPPPAASQDAFGENYDCKAHLPRWQYRRNQHRLVERMIEKFRGQESRNLFLVPAYVNLDCVNNYPQKAAPVSARNSKMVSQMSNGVHPTREGLLQIADSIYDWMKYEFAKN